MWAKPICAMCSGRWMSWRLAAARSAMFRTCRAALRLGFTPSFAIYLLGPLIQRYRDRFPGIVVTITEMAQEEMELALGADALDLGLAFSDVLAEDIEWLPLHTERLS